MVANDAGPGIHLHTLAHDVDPAYNPQQLLQMTLGPGTCLGPYEIVALLGAGGMGEGYRARDTTLGREVTIKIFNFFDELRRMGPVTKR